MIVWQNAENAGKAVVAGAAAGGLETIIDNPDSNSIPLV
jgi:hypothetical protein